MADLNNLISVSDLVTNWNVFASSRGAVELVIFRPFGNSLSIVGTSDLVTPLLGVNHFNLTHSIAVNKGDVVGLFLSNSAALPFSLSNCAGVGLMRLTGSNSGLSLNFTGSANRTYSVNVAGAATPEPSAIPMFVLGMVRAGLRSGTVNTQLKYFSLIKHT